jgi:hypothetical protein
MNSNYGLLWCEVEAKKVRDINRDSSDILGADEEKFWI